jgi:hypothetical protein
VKTLKYFFILLFLSSCTNPNNQFFYKAKAKKMTNLQLVKNADYNIDIEGYSLTEKEIDDLMVNIFKTKNINIIFTECKYKLIISKFDYRLEKKEAEVFDNDGLGTGQYGNQLNIRLDIESIFFDTINKKEQEFKWNLGDIKPVHSELLFDFFPADSENKYKPKVNIANYFNIVSHKIVKIVNRAERKE